jgi:uncharacterized protein YndB with AHSA1/START domain
MKWVLLILGCLAALVVLVAIIGSLLPKGHTAVRTIRLKQRPEAVWQAITDYAGAPGWRTEVKKVERLPDQNGHQVWRETTDSALTLETLEEAAPRRLVRKIADPSLPFGGTWTYEIAPAEGGCTITITENGEVYNPLFRVISKMMDPSATIRGYLRALAKKFGEEVAL